MSDFTLGSGHDVMFQIARPSQIVQIRRQILNQKSELQFWTFYQLEVRTSRCTPILPTFCRLGDRTSTLTTETPDFERDIEVQVDVQSSKKRSFFSRIIIFDLLTIFQSGSPRPWGHSVSFYSGQSQSNYLDFKFRLQENPPWNDSGMFWIKNWTF